MKPKSLVLLAVAMGCGLIAMLGVQQVLSQDNGVQEEFGQVLVAMNDIVPGIPLDDTNTTFKRMQLSAIPEGAVTKQEEFEERALRLTAVTNEVIMISKLGERGQFGGSTEIPEGYRVGTVQVNTTKTHSGLILPGDFVDVVVTYKTRINGRMVNKTKSVLEKIQIFATDNVRKSGVSADATEINAKNISLLVTPHQYNVLMLSEKMGEITLALRNRADDLVADTEDVDDTIFEELSAEMGDYSDGSEDGQASDVREFLEGTESEPEEEQVVEEQEPEEPPRPMWTMHIYEGETVREEQVAIPDDMLPPPVSAQAAPAESAPHQDFLKGWLQKFLLGA